MVGVIKSPRLCGSRRIINECRNSTCTWYMHTHTHTLDNTLGNHCNTPMHSALHTSQVLFKEGGQIAFDIIPAKNLFTARVFPSNSRRHSNVCIYMLYIWCMEYDAFYDHLKCIRQSVCLVLRVRVCYPDMGPNWIRVECLMSIYLFQSASWMFICFFCILLSSFGTLTIAFYHDICSISQLPS